MLKYGDGECSPPLKREESAFTRENARKSVGRSTSRARLSALEHEFSKNVGLEQLRFYIYTSSTSASGSLKAPYARHPLLNVPQLLGSEESKELLKQLSTFESDSESDLDETVKKRCRRSNAQQEMIEEQTRYIRAKRMYLEKKYAVLSKSDALVDRIHININVQASGPLPTQHQRTKVDDNIEESLLS